MSLVRHLFTVAVLVAVFALAASADESKGQAEAKAPKELKNQTHCPVMGGKIDSTVFTDIQGQRVYHCCGGCSGALKKDPDKFFKKAAAEGVLFENIQTTCPVSGEELEDKSVFTDFEGRRVAFCCKKCSGTFNEDPARYLKKLDEGAEAQTDKKMKMDHSGHNH
jgi:YHS domain-containing protein